MFLFDDDNWIHIHSQSCSNTKEHDFLIFFIGTDVISSAGQCPYYSNLISMGWRELKDEQLIVCVDFLNTLVVVLHPDYELLRYQEKLTHSTPIQN